MPRPRPKQGGRGRQVRRRGTRADRPLLFFIGSGCALLGIALAANGRGLLVPVAVGLMAGGSLALSAFVVLLAYVET